MDALTLCIARADPGSGEARHLIDAHLRHAADHSPATARFSLGGAAPGGPTIRFYLGRIDGVAVAMGALHDLGDGTGEVKSMHVLPAARGRGAAGEVLSYLLAEAGRAGWHALLLETGTQGAFAPARRLYARHGFVPGPPFGAYAESSHSVYMRRALA